MQPETTVAQSLADELVDRIASWGRDGAVDSTIPPDIRKDLAAWQASTGTTVRVSAKLC